MATIEACDFFPYTVLSRSQWKSLRKASSLPINEQELEQLVGLNEPITLNEVADIYVPLAELLHVHATAYQRLQQQKRGFFHHGKNRSPFIIGLAGSVAVGKSTTARLLQKLLKAWPEHHHVDLVTTDGFLYPNETLEARGLMDKKGFPESYDLPALIRFLSDVKAGEPYVKAPVYSHLTYNIVEGDYQVVHEPDIVIVEGINVLQVNKRNHHIPNVFVSDFFDFSIYVDAKEEQILQWYIERFKLLQNTAFQDPNSYFHRFRHLSEVEAEQFATSIWKNINGVNLHENILPTKHRADLVLQKGPHHFVDEVKLRNI
ncbi:type I pantothenate kinase [Halalkalibacterium halodurans]|uniref:type I pantothenate kinase n=1 Tax=Halalkalibacterium halodurans TaxID=86665 RepID=UPI002AA9B4B6|nr:type I pantothenate kinase [Halalkalibacterium halodurans]MDY7223428.1 type I pantothenate kinase [Halalkalibacterium halodurans]MDY7242649.1 type I pantothenate kinase [Halalkalibacterium halodurans]MED4081644.1 type I pantothenate kinase [Halalkalibacterium halodurans]MED4085197.1 type I pantothenate kinase [Halalkalibacterium halodurans]MED4104169.1 type I pantothenate kinase [Halalkalibacterium halodurans]